MTSKNSVNGIVSLKASITPATNVAAAAINPAGILSPQSVFYHTYKQIAIIA